MRRSSGHVLRTGLAGATLLALALVGCAGGADDAAPEAPIEAPAEEPADAPAEAPAEDPAATDTSEVAEATGIVLSGGALEVELTDGGTTELAIDAADHAEAVAQVAVVAGEPEATGTNADCAADFATWGGLTLYGDPTSGALVGWSLREPVPAGVRVLDAEAALGATRAEALARFSGAADFSDGDTTIGREWTGEGYAGLFSGATETDTVTNLWSGNACIFR
ncbi:MAG: hypothetical protein RLZZ272_203 [Actinomycetota bacterium]